MSRRLATNVVLNWVGMGVTMLTGFIVAPYLVHRLGDTVYGLWILIASMSGYFGLLDLGVRGSVGRYVAYFRARGEEIEVSRTLSTAFALLGGVAILALIATGLVLLVFFHLFDVPPEHVAAARLAILIIGINLALTFPVSVFDGVLWGFERFDLLNAVDIPTTIVRTGLTFWFVKGPDDILALAWITLITTAGNELLKMVLAFHCDRELRIRVRFIDRTHAKNLYGYGFWQFLLQIARQVSGQIGPLVIGGMVAVAAVTPYSIAARLIQYASQFIVAATGVLTPLATALHARNDARSEKHLFVEGGKWCTAFALMACAGLIGLGEPLLKLWMGPAIASSSMPMLLVLTCGELLAMSQWLTYSIMLGKAKHRAVAISSLAEGVIAGVGGALVAPYWGAYGVCWVFAVAGFACRGVFQVVYACRVMNISGWQYLSQAIMGPAALGVAAYAVLALVVWSHTPDAWLEFFSYGIGFAVAYAAAAVLLLGGLRYLPRQGGQLTIGAVEKVNG